MVDGQPFWLEEAAEPLARRRLRGRPEVEIVGGGVTGCACALGLATAGVRVRLHEAREVASGASGRNGGFALRGGAMPFDAAIEQLGADAARRLWALTEGWLDRLAGLAGDAFRRTGSLRLAVDAPERDAVEREYEALRGAGFDAVWRADLDPPLAERFEAALEHPRDGALQPARWVRRLAGLAAEAGAEIRERSRVESVDGLEGDVVVIATDGYTQGLVPELDRAIRPARGQVLATAPLARELFPRPHYARYGYDYWQQLPDRRLVVGGCRDAARREEATAEEAVTPLVQVRIEAFLADVLGEAPPITHRWAGIWGVTEDGLPLAGRLPGSDRLWVACGYSGHGNVLGLACGELVADAIGGRPAPELALFDPAGRIGEPEPERELRPGPEPSA
jgi:glycine/D-amino acid oxidase-like deaminating enzyme